MVTPLSIILALTAVTAAAQHEQAFSFNGTNGASPQGGVVADAAGNLYGSAGGQPNDGVVYEISPSGGKAKQTVLYYFGPLPDGAGPLGDLILDTAGNLYGVTWLGGTSDEGTIFELSPPAHAGESWTESVLYSFSGGTDGAHPMAGLAMDQAGNLYGTTSIGGAAGLGVVFELSPPSLPGGIWEENVLYAFSGMDGANPMARILIGQSGNLFGTTVSGGLYNQGAAFELTPVAGGWNESVIKSFQGTKGREPQAGLTLGPGGSLYGTTAAGGAFGGGTVFGLRPPSEPGGDWGWIFVYSFNGSDGSRPLSTVLLGNSNILYGTTAAGMTKVRFSKYQDPVASQSRKCFTPSAALMERVLAPE